MKKQTTLTTFAALFACAFASANTMAAENKAPLTKPAVDKSKENDPRVKRGGYLVWFGGCHDCHTPLVMSADGPLPDFSRALSGHPEQMQMPPAPTPPPGPWIVSAGATLTAWSGPWGTSFTANLTPDKETGLGSWTPEMFIATMRTGKHMGRGRKLLPPMPVQNLAGLSDEDLRAVFAFLQAIPPVKNRVPQPLPPPAPVTASAKKVGPIGQN